MKTTMGSFIERSASVTMLLVQFLLVEAGKCPSMCTCDNSKLTVACIGKNLTHVPPSVDEITVKLDLRNNHLKVLPRGAFQHTPYLTHLALQRCKIETVKEGAFRALGRLVSLNLGNNNIEVLYQESFDGLSSLKELHLDYNRVDEIRPGAFAQLGVLNLLVLTHNRLVYIPNMAFQGLNSIKWLRLGHNSLNNLATEAFTGLFTLTRLSLDHNELQFFPSQTMARLTEVTRLDLTFNPMTYLGEDSVSMAKLTHLYLDHLSLQDLSDTAFSQAPLLSHLDLSHNQLRYLDPLSGPKEMSRLNLTGNPIYCNCYLKPLKEWAGRARVKLLGACTGPPHLADEPLESVGAAELRCRSRQEMTEEEEEFEGKEESKEDKPTVKPMKKVKCPANCDCDTEAQHATCEARSHARVPRGFPSKTQFLDLRSNHFHNLPSNSFPGTDQVVSLHLEFCQIHNIEDGAFRGMKGLIYLYLSHNHLTLLGPGVFAGVPELIYLHLEGNKLAQFPGLPVASLPNLLVLHLEGNSIAELGPAGLLKASAPKLMGLYLTNNTIATIAKGALDSAVLDTLHLESNRLSEVPTQALSKASALEELSLSENPIRWIAPRAFQPFSKSLKRLYMEGMGLEKMSKESLTGLGPQLRRLSLGSNQLDVLPDLSHLTGLREINLADNPLLCDCSLLSLRRWMEKVSVKVTATCAHPPEVKGKKVRDVQVFKGCPNHNSSSKGKEFVKGPKSSEPRPTIRKLAKSQKAKLLQSNAKPTKQVKPSAKNLEKKTMVTKRTV